MGAGPLRTFNGKKSGFRIFIGWNLIRSRGREHSEKQKWISIDPWKEM